MSGALLFLSLIVAEPAAATPPDTTTIKLRDEAIRVGDLAHASVYRDLVVARLPRGVSHMALTEAQRRALLRNRVPGVSLALRHRGVLRVNGGAATRPARATRGTCFALRADVADGAYLSREDVEQADCRAAAGDARVRYDAGAAAPVARYALPAGTYLGRVRVPEQRPLAAGVPLLLRTVVGPVIVEREVTSLQPGRAGRRLFVRTEDGKMLASQIASAQEGGQ